MPVKTFLRLFAVVCTSTLTGLAAVPAVAAASDSSDDFAVRMTAATTPITDRAGHVWQARSDTLGTSNLSSALVGKDVAETTDDELYRRNAWNATGFSTPVPSADTYRVRLLLAEDFYWKAGQRVFGVKAEGATVVDSVDIAGTVGKGVAYDVTFDVRVDDGRLDLAFAKKIENPLVSAIEVTRVPPVDAKNFDVRVTSGESPLTHGGATWQPTSAWLGPARRSSALEGQPIGSTPDDELYRPATWGMTGWKTPVPEAGRYTVQLFMTESRYNEVGKRVFDVTAEGRDALPKVDLFKAVGVRTAYAPSFDVDVTDGVLDLGFVNRADVATVAAIRVTRAGDTTPVVPDPVADPASFDRTATDVSAQASGAAKQNFVSRMVARPQPVTDSTGARWNRWGSGLSSWRRSTTLANSSVGGTTTPELYRENVWGVRGYSLPVSEDRATYRVRLLMAEDYFTKPGQRVFDVKAEGRTAAEGVDIVAAVGARRAHDVVFETTVDDGVLDLSFVKRVDQPLISAIEVTSITPVTPPSAKPHRVFAVSSDSFWTQDVTKAPVSGDSAATVSQVADDVESRYGGTAGFNAYNYSVGYHVAGKTDPYVTVDRSCGGTTWTPGVYDGAAHFLDVPVPAEAVPAVGSDSHMSIYDPRTDKLWSFWQMRRSTETGRWTACWGGRLDDVSKSQGYFPAGFGAAASGLAMTPGMVTQDEVRRGRIDHAVAIVVPNARRGEFSWPANRTDGVSSSSTAVMEGQRLRLDPNLDLDAYDLTPAGRIIAEAAQKYGFIPVDTGGAVAVLGQSGDLEEALTGENPWRHLIGDDHWDVMKNFPWRKMQALPKDYGRR